MSPMRHLPRMSSSDSSLLSHKGILLLIRFCADFISGSLRMPLSLRSKGGKASDLCKSSSLTPLQVNGNIVICSCLVPQDLTSYHVRLHSTEISDLDPESPPHLNDASSEASDSIINDSTSSKCVCGSPLANVPGTPSSQFFPPNLPYLNPDHLPSFHSHLREMVKLPDDGMEKNEWIATHIFHLAHNTNLLYSMVSEACTSSSCPTMSAPSNGPFLWVDERGKKLKLSAPHYIESATSFLQKMVLCEDIFPTTYDTAFPKEFEVHVRKACKLMFNCVSHIIATHYPYLLEVGGVEAAKYSHAIFAHLVEFGTEFGLLSESKDIVCLEDLVSTNRMRQQASQLK